MLCVLLCYRLLSAHWVFLVVAGCLVLCVCAPVLASLVRARGLAFRLGGCLLGFPAVVCAVTPFPTISSLCNKHQGTEQHTQHHTALSATKAKERDHSLTPGIQATRAQRLQPQQRRRANPRRPKRYLAAGRHRQSRRHTNDTTTSTVHQAPHRGALWAEPCTALQLLGHPKATGSSKMLLWHQRRRTTCKDNTEQRARRDHDGYR